MLHKMCNVVVILRKTMHIQARGPSVDLSTRLPSPLCLCMLKAPNIRPPVIGTTFSAISIKLMTFVELVSILSPVPQCLLWMYCTSCVSFSLTSGVICSSGSPMTCSNTGMSCGVSPWIVESPSWSMISQYNRPYFVTAVTLAEAVSRRNTGMRHRK